jgi:Flp pilus assembly protein TadG
MKLYKSAPKKTKAQAMVEFAIVLPLLLLLLYGLLEAGRLLFIYSTIVTASRQAVRYGSATGQGLTTTVPRYQDCNGIRAAAQKVDFLNAFDDSDIHIFHDEGPNPATPGVGKNEAEYCTGTTDTWAPTNNSTRLVVKIAGDYLPIVPKIIPFIERSSARGNAIQANSARTILVSVSIVVTVPPSTFLPDTPTATATIATPTFTPSNTPTNTATNTPVFTDTPSITPSPTITFTATVSPTITLTPSITPTRVTSGCDLLNTGAGTITLSGDTMTMTIPNPNVYPVTFKDIFVVWNSDKGHQTGNDKSLILLSAGLLGSSPFWTGSPTQPAVGPSAYLPIPVVLPANSTSTIVFTFNQSYDKFSKSEEIFINLLTPGCEGFPIHKTYQ